MEFYWRIYTPIAVKKKHKTIYFLLFDWLSSRAGLFKWPVADCACLQLEAQTFYFIPIVHCNTFLSLFTLSVFQRKSILFSFAPFLFRAGSVPNLLWASAPAIWNYAVVSPVCLLHLLVNLFHNGQQNLSHSHPRVPKCLYNRLCYI